MLIPEQHYEYVPEGGDPKSPVVIVGLQEYSPGQSRRVTVWRFEVPEGVAPQLASGFEVDNFAQVQRTLLDCFRGETVEGLRLRLKSVDQSHRI